jgi:hypothetical protein
MLPAVRIASVNSKSASARLLKNAWSRARNARRLASGVCSSATDSWHASSLSGPLVDVLYEDDPIGTVEVVGVQGEVAMVGRRVGARG